MNTETEEIGIDIIFEHRWLTTVWRCACDSRNVRYPVSEDAFYAHAQHVMDELNKAGIIKDLGT